MILITTMRIKYKSDTIFIHQIVMRINVSIKGTVNLAAHNGLINMD
jgi:hypothetical protein